MNDGRDDGRDDGDERSGVKRPKGIPAEFSVETVSQFSSSMFSWLWDCCDDNMAPNVVGGPVRMRLLSVDNELIFKLPVK